MATNWPTEVWNPQDPLADDRGMVPFQMMDPGTAVLQDRGLTYDDYREHKGSISDSSIRAWDVMENPFYQAMAEYEGYDWDTLKAQFNEEIGPIEDQPHSVRVRDTGPFRRDEYESSIAGITGYNPFTIGNRTQTTGKNFDNYADAAAWAEENGYDESDIQMTAQPQGRGGASSIFGGTGPGAVGIAAGAVGVGAMANFFGMRDGDDDEERFWGITDEKWIERFNDWTGAGEDLIKKFKRQDAPIIRRGPSAADYGIVREDNNIFAHYGLDRPPADPKELATNYEWNLTKTWTSDVSYAVPPGLKRVNLGGDPPSSNPILAET